MIRWTVRRANNGMPLGVVESNDIDYALDFARRKYRFHDVTVDNLEPIGKRPQKPKIRYLDTVVVATSAAAS